MEDWEWRDLKVLGTDSLCLGDPQIWGTEEAAIRPLAMGTFPEARVGGDYVPPQCRIPPTYQTGPGRFGNWVRAGAGTAGRGPRVDKDLEVGPQGAS